MGDVVLGALVVVRVFQAILSRLLSMMIMFVAISFCLYLVSVWDTASMKDKLYVALNATGYAEELFPSQL